MRALPGAGLVVEQSVADDARVSLYRIEAAAFTPLRDWLGQVEDLWREQLQSFKAHAERARPARKAAR